MTTVRKQILLNAAQNERLRKLRAATGVSESEIVRRALEAYDPAGSRPELDDELRDALEALVEQNAKTARALESAEAEIAATERYLRELRAERDREAAAGPKAGEAPAGGMASKPESARPKPGKPASAGPKPRKPATGKRGAPRTSAPPKRPRRRKTAGGGS